jgi:hypothetical protein
VIRREHCRSEFAVGGRAVVRARFAEGFAAGVSRRAVGDRWGSWRAWGVRGGSSGVIRRGRCGREFMVGGRAVVRVGFAAVRGRRIVASSWRRAGVTAGVRGGKAIRRA